MAQQTRLEQEGIDKRNETMRGNVFYSVKEAEKNYSDKHDTARTHDDDKHILGKGTGHGGHTYVVPGESKSKTMINKSNFDTENGGGAYDIHGRNNVGGRNFLKKISKYGPDKQYGIGSIDTSANIEEGQYRIG